MSLNVLHRRRVLNKDLPFLTVWKTTVADESITLPYDAADGVYSGIIDWGDDSTSVNSLANQTHTYSVAGTYTIKITGTIEGWNFNGGGDALKLYEILQWGTLKLIGGENAGTRFFYQCQNLVITAVDILDTSLMVGMYETFRNCLSITTIPSINDWDLTNIDRLQGTFINCNQFNQPLNLNVPLVQNCVQMFYGAAIFNSDVTLTTSTVLVNLTQMFRSAGLFNSVLSISNTSNVTIWSLFFQSAKKYNQPLSLDTSAATNMQQMMTDTDDFVQDLDVLDYSNVTNMISFMISVGAAQYPATKYDALLIKLAATAPDGVTLGMGDINYTAAGVSARDTLVSTKGWTITDGGII